MTSLWDRCNRPFRLPYITQRVVLVGGHPRAGRTGMCIQWVPGAERLEAIVHLDGGQDVTVVTELDQWEPRVAPQAPWAPERGFGV